VVEGTVDAGEQGVRRHPAGGVFQRTQQGRGERGGRERLVPGGVRRRIHVDVDVLELVQRLERREHLRGRARLSARAEEPLCHV